MKILIWFICIFINAMITTLLKENGVLLGAIPTVALLGGTFWIAKSLCKAWDNYKSQKQDCEEISKEQQPKDQTVEEVLDSEVEISNDVVGIKETVSVENASEEALKTIVETQVKEIQKAMEDNSQNQLNNETDAEFGLVPEKPIYTLATKMVDGEIEYLNRLCTINGEKIKWNRRGSTSVDGINGMIDIYDTYLMSGAAYKTIYINMYGAKNSICAPSGFYLDNNNSSINYYKSQKESKRMYCSRCGAIIDNRTKQCTGCGKKYFRGFILNKFSITVIVLSVVLVASVIFNIVQHNKIDYLYRNENNLKDRVTKLEEKNSDLKAEVSDLEGEIWDNASKIDFFDEHVVFVEDDGTNKYHKYECDKFVSEYFWAYNTE